MKHTKGPWKLCPTANGWSIRPADDIQTVDRCMVNHSREKIVGDACGFNWENTEHGANAQRIVDCVNACEGIVDPSLVPEFLKALKSVVERPPLAKELNEWDALIARAEGRSKE